MHKHNWAIRVEGDERTLEALLPMLTGLPAQLRHETMQNSKRALTCSASWRPGFLGRL